MVPISPLLFALSAASAAPITLDAGIGGGVASDASPAVVGHGGVRINTEPLAFIAGAREGWGGGEHRVLSNVYFGVELPERRGVNLALLFSHNHEVPWERFLEEPIGSMFGVSEEIRHRSGLELRLSKRHGEVLGFEPLEGWWSASAIALPGSEGPTGYLLLEAGLGLGVGRFE